MSVPNLTVFASYSGVVGVPMPLSPTPLNASWTGGASFIGFLEVSGNLPTSLTYNGSATSSAAQGYLVGTPLIRDIGTFALQWTAENTDGLSVTRSMTFTVYALAIINAPTARAQAQVPWVLELSTTSPATSFEMTSGVLPPGLTFNPTNGRISGRATALGGYAATFTATNVNGTSAPFTLTITVNSMASPTHNLNSHLIGTAEFSFALNASSRANASALGYRDIGNLTAHVIVPEGERKEHWGAYRGIVRNDRNAKRKLKLSYKLTGDEFAARQLALVIMGSEGSALTRLAIAAVAGTAIPFSVGSPSVSNRWYDILDASGNRVKFLTGVTITGKVEGTDFELDLALGRIRFITPQTSNLTPTITAPAIVAGDVNSFIRATPMNLALARGYGRLVVFDENSAQTMVLDHSDFSCEVEVDGEVAILQDDWSKLNFIVRVTADVGNFDCRESA